MEPKRTAYPSDQMDKVLLRLPAGMREQLRIAADKNGRSSNSEIVARLQESLDANENLPEMVRVLAEGAAQRMGVSFNEALCTLVAAGDAKNAPHVTYMRIERGSRFETVEQAIAAVKQFVPAGSVQYSDMGD